MLLPEATLEEVNRLWTIARAFSNTAHAVNNSLQVIGGRAELLETRAGIDPAIVPSLQAVRVQSGRAAAAISDLLAYTRGAADSQSVNLNDIVNTTVAMRAHTLSRARVAIAVERQGGESFHVRASRRELLQLLLNLVLMVEAHVSGRNQARIVIRLVREPSQFRVVVTGSASTDGESSGLRTDLFNAAAQQRVVIALTHRLNGGLAIENSAQGVPAFTLTIPSDGN